MKKLILLLLLTFLITSCSDKPSGSMIDKEFETVRENVKKFLGQDYDAENFSIIEEGYTSEEKNTYKVKYKFDLNKPISIFRHKDLPGELMFQKNQEGKWECTFNSGNPTGLFNLFQ